ncbi:MAG: ACT domain-containing protein, partial [Candidatus Hydrogenedentes bacterium]|nr:ACT domain-containing protein [Candidatus Hydrogenedentota bacterium]
LAASTEEAQVTVAIEIAEQMIDYLNTGAIVNAVNVPSLDSDTRKKLQPLLYLAERLGQFQATYHDGTPTAIEIEYNGDLGITDSYPITAGVLTGFLAPMVETVNMVSAPSQLEARGISSSEKRGAHESDYAFEIGVTVTTSTGSHTVKGTLFQDNDPRIISIDGTRVDARPEGYMLVCRNEDQPLVLGRVATRIGDAGVNIANLTLGRDKRGGNAFTVLNLDQPVDEATLAEIRKMDHVLDARLVALPEAN